MNDLDTRHALVFAVAHELGNHLAGLRLEAHLLDEDLGPAGLARAALAIDGLAAQSAPLLALLRPLLTPGSSAPPSSEASAEGRSGPHRGSAPTCASVLEGLRRELETEGVGGRPIELAIDADAERDARALDGLHALLRALIGAPADLGDGPIRLALTSRSGGIALVCELPGEGAFEAADADAGAAHVDRSTPTSARMLRGRALACAIARMLVTDAGGRVSVRSEAGRSQIELRLPLEGGGGRGG